MKILTMTKTFFISDLHISHERIATVFTKEDGTPARVHPERGDRFQSAEEMDELLIERWNKVVSSGDRVYVLGDFVMHRAALSKVQRLNGRICLVKGNHDLFKISDYQERCPNIDKYEGVVMFPKLGWVCCHIPVHPHQLQGRWTHCIHGHTHTHRIIKEELYGFGSDRQIIKTIDPRYQNMSVEQINYTPISIDELKAKIEKEEKDYV